MIMASLTDASAEGEFGTECLLSSLSTIFPFRRSKYRSAKCTLKTLLHSFVNVQKEHYREITERLMFRYEKSTERNGIRAILSLSKTKSRSPSEPVLCCSTIVY